MIFSSCYFTLMFIFNNFGDINYDVLLYPSICLAICDWSGVRIDK